MVSATSVCNISNEILADVVICLVNFFEDFSMKECGVKSSRQA